MFGTIHLGKVKNPPQDFMRRNPRFNPGGPHAHACQLLIYAPQTTRLSTVDSVRTRLPSASFGYAGSTQLWLSSRYRSANGTGAAGENRGCVALGPPASMGTGSGNMSLYGVNNADLDWTSGAYSVWWKGMFTGSVTSNCYMILRGYAVSASDNQGWWLRANNAGDNVFSWSVLRNSAASSNDCVSSTALAKGDYTVVGTSDGTTIRYIYVNGVNTGSKSTNLTPVSLTATSPNGDVRGMTGYNAGGNSPMFGAGFWKRELSENEIFSLYWNPAALVLPYAGVTGIQTGFVAVDEKFLLLLGIGM